MKKRLLLGAMMLSATFSWAQSTPYVGVAPGDIVSGGDYYLYNVESGLWLQNNDRKANDWHTRGQLGVRGLDFELNASGDGYLINAKFGRKSLHCDNYYLDANDDHVWVFEAKAGSVSNAVTIKSGSRYLTADYYTAGKGYNNQYNAGTPGQNQWYLNNPNNSNNGTWQIVTKEERLAVMKEMGKTEPQDATWLVASPDFANNDTRYNKWTRKGKWDRGGGADGDWGRGSLIMESWNSGSEPHMYQTVSVPNGKYSFTLQGFYRDGPTSGVGEKNKNSAETIRAKYYAQGKTKVEKDLRSVIDGHVAAVLNPDRWRVKTSDWYVPDNMSDCSRCMNIDFGYPNDTLAVTVNAGTLTIGVQKNGGAEGDWVIFDNIKLTYLGPIDLSEILAGLTSAITAAEAIDQSKLTTAAAALLNEKLTAARAQRTSDDGDAIAAAASELSAVVNELKDMDITALKAAYDYMVGRDYDDATVADILANALTAAAVNDALGGLKVRFKQHVAEKSVQPTQFTNMTTAVVGTEHNDYGTIIDDHADGFYLYNVGTGRWFCGGDDWGAHAAVGFPGIKVTTPKNDYGTGKYNSIKTFLFNGNWNNGGQLGHNAYCDTGGNGWKFWTKDAEQGIYTIARNGNNEGNNSSNDYGRRDLLGFSDNTLMRLDSDKSGADNPYNQWIFVTEAQRDAMATDAMASADAEHPVDLTWKIKMPGFNQRERLEGQNQDDEKLAWTCNHENYRYNAEDNGSRHAICERGQNHADFCIDIYGHQWNDAFSWKQTISNLAPGKYRVKVQGYNNGGSAENKAKLVAGSESTALRERNSESQLPWQGYANTTWEAIEYFQNGLYWNEVECEVIDGNLEIGVESPSINGGHVVLFDNFRLEYVGPASSVATVSAAEYATYVAPFDIKEIPAGVEAFAAQNKGTHIHLEPVTEIPEGEAVVLKNQGSHTFYSTTSTATLGTDNDLVAATIDVIANGSQYILAKKNDVVGFYKATSGTTIAAGKAYIVSGNGINALYFEDEETAIVAPEAPAENGVIYNVAGQRISTIQRGINIVNGKKVLK